MLPLRLLQFLSCFFPGDLAGSRTATHAALEEAVATTAHVFARLEAADLKRPPELGKALADILRISKTESDLLERIRTLAKNRVDRSIVFEARRCIRLARLLPPEEWIRVPPGVAPAAKDGGQVSVARVNAVADYCARAIKPMAWMITSRHLTEVGLLIKAVDALSPSHASARAVSHRAWREAGPECRIVVAFALDDIGPEEKLRVGDRLIELGQAKESLCADLERRGERLWRAVERVDSRRLAPFRALLRGDRLRLFDDERLGLNTVYGKGCRRLLRTPRDFSRSPVWVVVDSHNPLGKLRYEVTVYRFRGMKLVGEPTTREGKWLPRWDVDRRLCR